MIFKQNPSAVATAPKSSTLPRPVVKEVNDPEERIIRLEVVRAA